MRKLKQDYARKEGRDLAEVCVRIALDGKAEDVVLLDVRKLASFTDYFVIMSGRSTRHVQGLAEAIENELTAKRISTKHSEGLREGLWVLLDFGDVLVHVFYHESRRFYDLEGLWRDAPRIEIVEPSTATTGDASPEEENQ
ncbi:MAG: ribosome silencing factor [Desulfobulbus sp.]|jgi:ribosome-associated protein